jgi:hypothetical protein
MTRQPEPWQTTHAGPFLAIEGSEVVAQALGDQRFRVEHPNGSQEVEGLRAGSAPGARNWPPPADRIYDGGGGGPPARCPM